MLVAYRRYSLPDRNYVEDERRLHLGSNLHSTNYSELFKDYTEIRTTAIRIDSKIVDIGLLDYLDDADIIVLPRVDSKFYASIQGYLRGNLDLEDLYKIFTVTLEGTNPLGYQVFFKSQRIFDCVAKTKCLAIEMTESLYNLKYSLESAKQCIRDYIANATTMKVDNLTQILNTSRLEFNELTIDEFIGGNYG